MKKLSSIVVKIGLSAALLCSVPIDAVQTHGQSSPWYTSLFNALSAKKDFFVNRFGLGNCVMTSLFAAWGLGAYLVVRASRADIKKKCEDSVSRLKSRVGLLLPTNESNRVVEGEALAAANKHFFSSVLRVKEVTERQDSPFFSSVLPVKEVAEQQDYPYEREIINWYSSQAMRFIDLQASTLAKCGSPVAAVVKQSLQLSRKFLASWKVEVAAYRNKFGCNAKESLLEEQGIKEMLRRANDWRKKAKAMKEAEIMAKVTKAVAVFEERPEAPLWVGDCEGRTAATNKKIFRLIDLETNSEEIHAQQARLIGYYCKAVGRFVDAQIGAITADHSHGSVQKSLSIFKEFLGSWLSERKSWQRKKDFYSLVSGEEAWQAKDKSICDSLDSVNRKGKQWWTILEEHGAQL